MPDTFYTNLRRVGGMHHFNAKTRLPMGMEGRTYSRTEHRLAFRLTVRIVDSKIFFNSQIKMLTKNIEKSFLFTTKHKMKMESKTYEFKSPIFIYC